MIHANQVEMVQMPSSEHRKETFRPLHDVLEETARVLDASLLGLTRVAEKDDLN